MRGPAGAHLLFMQRAIRAASEATPLSDVYSLGVMVYAMVTALPVGEITAHSSFTVDS